MKTKTPKRPKHILKTRSPTNREIFNKLQGVHLRTERESKDLTQVQMAKAIGISQPKYSKIEAGLVDMSTFEKAEFDATLNQG